MKKTLGVPLEDGTADIIRSHPQIALRKVKHATYQGAKHTLLHDVKMQVVETYQENVATHTSTGSRKRPRPRTTTRERLTYAYAQVGFQLSHTTPQTVFSCHQTHLSPQMLC